MPSSLLNLQALGMERNIHLLRRSGPRAYGLGSGLTKD